MVLRLRDTLVRTLLLLLLALLGALSFGAASAFAEQEPDTAQQPAATQEAAAAQEPDAASVQEGDNGVDEADADEVMVVTGEATPGEAPVMMREVYNANGRGAWLYRNGQYKEAFPYLLEAAESGFKLAQARVSYIYQQGLGDVPRDADAAIGWLGVAATPTTTPEIRNYYRRVLEQFPPEHRERIDEIVAEYRESYGTAATRVDCENVRVAGTFISRLKCDFRDAPRFRDALDSEEEVPQFVPPIESGP